ncbi:hypothetical protein Lal_00023967 [Lupinus albus]|nr:hypothetical protein Lal_00023967 [Lupinus albus]
MTRDNLYWLSHDQVALFKTFRGTASRCKQTINHAVPRIKQPSSLATERKGEKGGRNCVGRIYGGRKKEACISVQASVPRKERERKEAGIASAEFMEGERKKLV